MVCRKDAGDPTDPKNSLFVEFLRVAKALRPNFVIMENVPNIENARTHNGESVIGIIKRELKQLDYHVAHSVLEATDFGIPQMRKRLFIVASVNELESPFPSATHCVRDGVGDLFGGPFFERCPTLWEAISDLPALEAGEGSQEQDYGDSPICFNRSRAVLITLADLYDPLAMPPELLKAHTELDRAVEKCYRSEPFHSDRERVEFLVSLYEKLTAPLLPVTPKAKGRRSQSAAGIQRTTRQRTPGLPGAKFSRVCVNRRPISGGGMARRDRV